MDIPEDVGAWNFETIVAIVEQHEFEPGRFDYKTVLNPTLAEGRDDHLISIRRTAVSVANGGGGYILFGIRDRTMKVAAARDRIGGGVNVGLAISS
jgi:predicted HTH transcriptional regulator